jgi:putative polyketide hydroxylase
MFRVWGLEAAVRAAAQELEQARDVVWAPALTAPETRRARYGGAGENLAADSPAVDAACAQDKLEPVLLEAARSNGLGEVRFARELTALTQDRTGIEAVIADRVTGQEMMVRAGYVIAADGAQSPVRSMLGIGMAGPGVLAHRMGIYFRADLARAVAGRPALMYWVGPEQAPAGVLAAVNLADLWLYMVPGGGFHPGPLHPAGPGTHRGERS